MKIYFYLLYKITNLLNDKYYIGIHKTSNIDDDYMGSGKVIKSSIKKYGVENFKKEILYYCSSYDELLEKEKEIVNVELLKDENCYNIALGGKGSWLHVDHKKGREMADTAMSIKYGENFRSILGKKAVLKNKANKVGIFAENFENPFKCNSQIQQLGNTPEARSKASKTAKETYKQIKHQQGSTNSQYGTCWITKDNINKKIKKEELNSFLEEGWVKGRVIKPC